MGLINKLKGELVDIIEWLDDSRSTLAWRFPRYQNEIKNGAQLIVREGQQAVFVYRGEIADVFDPGNYELISENLPVLSTLQGWKHGFDSPFRSEVYFLNTRQVTDLRWGTPQPVTVRDPDFKMVQVRANGLCVVRIADAETFLREVIGTDSAVEAEEITELLRRVISLAFSDMIMATGLGAIDLQGRQVELSEKLREFVQERVDDEFGLEITSVTMNISLPDEITQAMTRGVARGVEEGGYAHNVGDVQRLQQVRAADAMLAAADNPGGSAMGDAMQMGMGIAMAGQMADTLGGAMRPGQPAGAQPATAPGAVPPPLPGQVLYHVDMGGRAGGPYSIPQIQAGIASGQVTPSTLVWANGMASWAAAGTVPELAPLFEGPPPMPPQDGAPPSAATGSGRRLLTEMDETPDPALPPPLPDPGPAPAPPPLPGEAVIHDAAQLDEDGPDEDGLVEDDLVDDEAAAEEITRRALLHQTERTRTYPCVQCGGELVFGVRDQKLKCPHCGNLEEIIEDVGREVAEQDFRGAMAAIHSGALLRTSELVGGPDAEKEVVCQNCGGHTTFRGTLTAVRCPYCATPIQRDDIHDAPSRLAVDGVLPFAIDEDTANDAIRKWINSRWFAPNEFKKYSTTGSFTSIYAAYFTYDADTTTRYRGQRGDNYTVTVGSGQNRRTVVRTRWSPRSGTVRDSFDDLPVLANTGFEDRHVRALEPWPTQNAKPFSAEYIAGHLCRTYDHDVEQSFGPAKHRIEGEIRNTIRRDIGGDHQRISSMSVRYDALTFKHLLLPIWLLTVVYQQRPFQVFINGVTGEVQGQRPYSVIKISIAVILALVVAGLIFVLYQGSGGSNP